MQSVMSMGIIPFQSIMDFYRPHPKDDGRISFSQVCVCPTFRGYPHLPRGVSHQILMGGTPILPNRGLPPSFPTPRGTPILPHCGGTQSFPTGGWYPHPSQLGVPLSFPTGGVPPSFPTGGTPFFLMGVPPPLGLDGGLTLDGGTPIGRQSSYAAGSMPLTFTQDFLLSKHSRHKKVLLRECKRHTVCHVASGCYAHLSPDIGVPHPVLDRGYPPILILDGVPPCQQDGVIPVLIFDGVPPCQQDGIAPPSRPEMGINPPPPGQQDGVPPVLTWDGVCPHPDLGWGTPPLQV